MLMYEALRLQDELQGLSLGRRRWVALAEDRQRRGQLATYRELHSASER